MQKKISRKTKQSQDTNAMLHGALNERTREVQEAKAAMDAALEQLKFVDKSKSEFIAIAAHQLLGPLSAIKWTFRLMADGDVGALDPEQKNLLEKAYQVNERLIAVVNDLLDISRIEEGQYGYTFKPVDLVAYLQGILNGEAHDAKAYGVTLTLQKPAEIIGMVSIDPDRLHFALENLIKNAIRYNHEGGRVVLGIAKEERQIHITVQDTGIGVPQAQIPQLFHKFFRAENARHLQADGTGLGLYIVRLVTLRHGGRVWAQSEEGVGSTFHITLPLVATDIPSENEFRKKLRKLET